MAQNMGFDSFDRSDYCIDSLGHVLMGVNCSANQASAAINNISDKISNCNCNCLSDIVSGYNPLEQRVNVLEAKINELVCAQTIGLRSKLKTLTGAWKNE